MVAKTTWYQSKGRHTQQWSGPGKEAMQLQKAESPQRGPENIGSCLLTVLGKLNYLCVDETRCLSLTWFQIPRYEMGNFKTATGQEREGENKTANYVGDAYGMGPIHWFFVKGLYIQHSRIHKQFKKLNTKYSINKANGTNRQFKERSIHDP